MAGLPWYGAEEIMVRVPPARAVAILREALLGGLEPSTQPPRTATPTTAGHILLMPAEHGMHVGVKLATVAPENPPKGVPRIQAMYVLLDAVTLSAVALLDGTALTTRRTPAVSALALERLTAPAIERLIVIGTGPQGIEHVRTLGAIREIAEVVLVGRDAGRTATIAETLAQEGHPVRPGSIDAVADADLIVCATTATEPLFDRQRVRDDACVVAVGSHTPDARELDAALLGAATVVVEDRDTALREAGDVMQAVHEGALRPDDLVELAPLVRGQIEVDGDRPRVIKTVGMAWQDLVVASAVVDVR